MIGYLRGKVKYLAPEYVLLDVNGVGYEVICSGAAFSRLSGVPRGEEGELFTCMLREKELFLRLNSVQGVGAKMAIAVLSAMSPDDVSEAIASADAKRFAAVKGVGKKTAERIILELHGKISADALIGAENSARASVPAEENDAVSALIGMGFTKQESARAVERAKSVGAKTVEEIIAAALRGM